MNTLQKLVVITALMLSGHANAGTDWSTDSALIAESQRLEAQAVMYRAAGDNQQALSTYSQLQSLIHRSAGVNALSQAPILMEMINIHLSEGDFRSAEARQNFYVRIHTKAHGKNSHKLLPVLKQKARWEGRSGRWSDAMFTFEDAIKIVKTNLKKQKGNLELKQELLALNEAADIAATRMYAQDDLLAGRR